MNHHESSWRIITNHHGLFPGDKILAIAAARVYNTKKTRRRSGSREASIYEGDKTLSFEKRLIPFMDVYFPSS
jgi:hypothetical protein